MKFLSHALAWLVILGSGGAACGSASRGNGGGSAGDGGPTLSPDSGPSLLPTGGDGGPTQGALTITPIAPVVTVVTGKPPPTVQFNAFSAGAPTGAAWSIDRGELGTIDANGLFTQAGTIAGVGNVLATVGGQKAKATITVKIQTTQQGDPGWSANPPPPGAGGYGGVGGNGPGAPPSPGQVTTLGGAPTADPTVSLLYPYDATVWPQGLLAPLLQWNPGAHAFDSVYVHIEEANYEYKGYFAANKTPFVNMPIPQPAWDAMAFSNGGEPVKITLVFAQGSSVFGPYAETWKIAPATMKGTIYYNSYGTTLVKNSGTDGLDSYGHQYGAGTLAIAPGATSPTLSAGIDSVNASGDGTGCRVCHTVSADGKSLVTQASTLSAGDYSKTVHVNLANDTTAGAGTPLATGNLAFPAITKDGTLLLSSSGGMINGDGSSLLYAMPAGTPVPGVTGLAAGFRAALPAFSPDSAHASFNFYGGTLAAGGVALSGDAVSLAMLDFDGKAAFTNPRVLYTPTSGGTVTYSSFFPNSAGIVFEVELTHGGGFGFTWHQNTAELWWLDVASGKAHRLDQLNGYDASGKLYLPDNAGGAKTHTAAQDATLNYEPTVNPIVSGGYAWVVFTSRRMYGNVAQLDPWISDPRQYPWTDQVTDKKLWVAAVDLNAAPGADASHPAFYLPAQELHAGNARGYWAVEPCHPDGQSCQTGDQCCGGYCQPGGADGGLICTAQAPTCSGVFEKCTTTSDCCGAAQGITCINNICGQSVPPK